MDVRILRRGEEGVLGRAADVFDGAVDGRLLAEFLADPRHHLAVAIDDGVVMGMESAVHYVHPDKLPQLWINEVGVAGTHRGRGVGKALMAALLGVGKSLGCTEAWVLTDRGNEAAMRLYGAMGGVPQDTVMFTFQFDGK